MTRAASQQDIADRNYDLRKHDAPDVRIRSVAYLTAYLDTLLRLNAIPKEFQEGIRATVNSTRRAFDLPELGVREDA